MSELRASLGRLALENPVLVASGTFGYGIEFQDAVPIRELGGIMTKTITLQPRMGNPPPRLIETPAGMLNSVGLQNVGLDVFVREKLPAVATLGVPIIVSVLGESIEEIETLCSRLSGEQTVSAIELNLSCPNLHSSSRPTSHVSCPIPSIVAQDPEATFAMVAAARRKTDKMLIAKLSPDVTDVTLIAQAAERAGAEALSVGNTFIGMSLDPAARRSRLGSPTGGLSGPAIRPLAVYRVWRVRQAVKCPIIGVGGIRRAEDVLEFLLAGASAVAVGTASFADPSIAVKILRSLPRAMAKYHVDSLQQLVGTLQTEPGSA